MLQVIFNVSDTARQYKIEVSSVHNSPTVFLTTELVTIDPNLGAHAITATLTTVKNSAAWPPNQYTVGGGS